MSGTSPAAAAIRVVDRDFSTARFGAARARGIARLDTVIDAILLLPSSPSPSLSKSKR